VSCVNNALIRLCCSSNSNCCVLFNERSALCACCMCVYCVRACVAEVLLAFREDCACECCVVREAHSLSVVCVCVVHSCMRE